MAAKVGIAVVVFVALAIAGWVWMFSNTGCAIVTVETLEAYRALQPATMPTGEPTPLNETRIESEMPELARLFDEALANGRASEDRERTARAMYDVLLREAPNRLFSWRGEDMQYSMAVC